VLSIVAVVVVAVRRSPSGHRPGNWREQGRVETGTGASNPGGRMRERERGLNGKSTGRAPDGGAAHGVFLGYGPGTVSLGATGFNRTGRTRRASRGAGERIVGGAAWEFRVCATLK
jgi:hypothetical protein